MGLPLPRRGDAVSVHFTGPDGKSYAAVLKVSQIILGSNNSVSIYGDFHASGELKGIDMRLENQRKAIEGMLDHMKEHCPALMGTGSCAHIGSDKPWEASDTNIPQT